MAKKNDIEKISLDIANYWTSNDFLTETNERCGTLVAFDWRNEDDEHYLTEINTNIDLNKTECENFKFDVFVDFLKKNNFTFVLGLRNVAFEDNPSPEWTDKFKEILKSNEIDYDEYVVDHWPLQIPEFDVPDNIFILRYSYDEYSRIDQFAASQYLFENFMKSNWEKYYKNIIDYQIIYGEKYYKDEDIVSIEKDRVIIFCSNIENLVLKDNFVK